MTTQLIILPEQSILVSDEEIVLKNEYFYNTISFGIFKQDMKKELSVSGTSERKVIAGIGYLPSIDWNGLEEEFGIVDVEKLAKEEFKQDGSLEAGFLAGGFKQGFKKSQSLQQPKVFDVEIEIEKYMTDGWVPTYNNPAEIDYRPKITNNSIKILNKLLQSKN